MRKDIKQTPPPETSSFYAYDTEGRMFRAILLGGRCYPERGYIQTELLSPVTHWDYKDSASLEYMDCGKIV